MAPHVYTNFTNGYIVEYGNMGKVCQSWLLLPAENLWPQGLRGFLYIFAMGYLFMGIAIVSDVFMCSIETITSKRRTIIQWDDEKKEKVEIEVLFWNETVANLTLMALGSSAPEIVLAIIETAVNLGNPTPSGSLGTFTIIGSAAFNLLVITAICIISVPSKSYKRIKEFGVFCMTSFWSIFAYIWVLIVVKFVTPNYVDIWEAFITFAFFPIMVILAYCQDNGWWAHRCRKTSAVDVERNEEEQEMHVRVVRSGSQAFVHGPSKEIQALQQEKSHKHGSRTSLSIEAGSRRNSAVPPVSNMGSATRLIQNQHHTGGFARARFRHAAVRSMMGGKKHHNLTVPKPAKMAEVVDDVRQIHNLDVQTPSEELCGKFTFASPSYSVLESTGFLEVDILFYRSKPSKSTLQPPMEVNVIAGKSVSPGDAMLSSNPKMSDIVPNGKEIVVTGRVSVDFETREGSAKYDKDFKKTSGTLVFEENQFRHTIQIPIINDNQYEPDTEFFIILKNPQGDAGIGEPSITRVLIIDDDEPGEFSFDKPSYTADLKRGKLIARVVREKGSDGTVSIDYSTIDGTAKGGESLTDGIDFISTSGKLTFKHGETSKTITIDTSNVAKGTKNFIITLKNPSLGCKLGEHSAALGFHSQDKLGEALANVLDAESEDQTWGEQIIAAMTVSEDEDEDGNPIPLHWYDYLLHFIMFFWKVFFALIPPRNIAGAWPAFFLSLLGIALLTAFVEQLGHLLGCVINLRTAVTGITIVALGTSLPDTFASRTAALHDEYADAAIGNVTGSNSVNVFLGLGLPWVLGTLYEQFVNGDGRMRVDSENVFQSTIFFTTAAVICIFLLYFRRFALGGELGGKAVVKWLCGGTLFLLWVAYITLSSLVAYDSLWKLTF
ncbi:sodium/calcium exchanger 1-like [Tubulanus polymorphus]|uniref:sodium/calcium exchanger 1-like n=1 Tax=Tubulanus polymorphus TaxID=672921 RepID=UPI003DA20294